MSTTAVYQIFAQIKQLSTDDRSLLDKLLASLEEKEWQREARRARRVAREKGIDQTAIDEAVAQVRYGS